MGTEYIAPLAVSLILVVGTYAAAAYVRDHRPRAYRGVLRVVGDRAPTSPGVIAISAMIAFALLVSTTGAAGGSALAWISAALVFAVVIIAALAVLGRRAALVVGVLAVAVVGASLLLSPEVRTDALGGALAALPVLLIAAYVLTRRTRASR